MICGPLTDQLGHGARISDFIGSGTCEMVCRHVADCVARGLDGVHVHFGQRIKHVGHVAQLRPIILDVLTRGEMTVAFVPFVGNIRQLVHLPAAKRAIGNSHPQHICMQLQVETVHQA